MFLIFGNLKAESVPLRLPGQDIVQDRGTKLEHKVPVRLPLVTLGVRSGQALDFARDDRF